MHSYHFCANGCTKRDTDRYPYRGADGGTYGCTYCSAYSCAYGRTYGCTYRSAYQCTLFGLLALGLASSAASASLDHVGCDAWRRWRSHCVWSG